LGAVPLRVIAMRHNVFYSHMDVLVHFPATRRAELATSLPQHDGSIANGELRMDYDSVSLDAQTLLKPESSAEPLYGSPGVLVDEYRDDGGGWCGLI
jgi:hypothetical protein